MYAAPTVPTLHPDRKVDQGLDPSLHETGTWGAGPSVKSRKLAL